MYIIEIKTGCRRQKKPMKHIANVLISISLIFFLAGPKSTNAFFSAKDSVQHNMVSTGYWIPTLTMEILPGKPVRKNNPWHKTNPCVEFEALLGDQKDGVEIYYLLSEEDDSADGCSGKNRKQEKRPKQSAPDDDADIFLDGEKYTGKCVRIPDGKWSLQAQAVNVKNSDWRSEILEEHFSVDTQKPSIKDDFPEKNKAVQGEINLKFELSDKFPEKYELTIKNSQGKTVFEKKSETNGCREREYEHDWDTRKHADGEYEVEISASDLAGNESGFHRKIIIKNDLETEETEVLKNPPPDPPESAPLVDSPQSPEDQPEQQEPIASTTEDEISDQTLPLLEENLP